MSTTTVASGISMSPEVMLGKPLIRETRVPVYLIVDLVNADLSASETNEVYSELSELDIESALSFAQDEYSRRTVRQL